MDERFSSNDIAQLLADQAAIEPAKSENFIKELVDLINKGIRKDGIVRIKGFGTFKIILVRKRESVHVNTGERILIPTHHKLSFKPDDEFKDLINKPFSIFETVEDTSENRFKTVDTSLLENSTIEETELTSTEEQSISDHQIIEDEPEDISNEDQEDEDIIPPIKIPIGQESKDVSPPLKGEDKPISKTTISDEEAETPWVTNKITKDNAEQSTQTKTHKQKTASRHHKKKSSLMPFYIILGVLICICVGCIWYYFVYSRSFDSFSDDYNTRVSAKFALPADSTAVTQEKPLVSSEDSVEIKNDVDTLSKKPPGQQPTSLPNNAATSSSSKKRQTTSTSPSTPTTSSNNVLAKVRMESGNRLTLLAQKYYGNKIFWVYIYDYNKDKIGSNPDNVRTGMELLIPAKKVYGIDANDANSREKARKLQTQLISGKK